jgi:uncharacterized protein YecT (DUF1311 family)
MCLEVSVGVSYFWVARLSFTLLILATPITAQSPHPQAGTCKDRATTQLQLDDCANKELHTSEVRMESLLKRLGLKPDSPEQRAWESYRDAQLAAIYPPQDIASFGSVYPMCLAILKRSLTEGRIRDLKALTSSQEGDACYGYRLAARKSD